MIEIKVPGKLYIAGEYAVVKEGHDAILISVNKFIKVKIIKSHGSGSIKSFSNLKMIWKRDGEEIIVEQKDDRFDYIFTTMNTVESYIKELGISLDVYDIEVSSDLESQDGIKFGLGSSAAIVVAITKALLKYYNIKLSKLEIFKLCVLANIKLNTSGSCGDIASAVYTGIIKYTSFSRHKIKEISQNMSISNLLSKEWEDLKIERLDLNQNLKFLIAWTKSPASSNNLVRNSKRLVSTNEKFYEYFLVKSNQIVNDIKNSYKNGLFNTLKENIEENRKLLLEYAKKFNIVIETKILKDSIELAKSYGLPAKTSGAGGGDCSFAISDKCDNNDLIEKWKEIGIETLDLDIYEEKDE